MKFECIKTRIVFALYNYVRNTYTLYNTNIPNQKSSHTECKNR